MTLTKADLVQQVYEKHENLTKAQATESVEAFLRLSKDTLINGSDLLLSGFGKFNVRKKSPRRGRNPQTGDDLMLKARRVVTFKPSGLLRNKVNGGE
jgi:integration host factor subunit alpha